MNRLNEEIYMIILINISDKTEHSFLILKKEKYT